MEYQTIRVSEAGGAVTIAMQRPEVMNALSARMRAELLEAVTQAGARARVVVLTGSGRAFCSGQDLADPIPEGAAEWERVLREEYEPLLMAIGACPVPTVAAVNGAAAGAGANLALACDVVIAAESASFIQAFTRIGLMPDAGGTFWLPRQVGQARAMGAMLFADKVSARQAADWGMIWECVADAEFSAHLAGRVRQLAEGPTVAYQGIKDALRATWGNDLPAQLAMEGRGQGTCAGTADFAEGLAAFLGKRAPRFEGK